MRFLALIAFLACIPAANWLIGNVGTRCIPDGPCVIPVGFGLDKIGDDDHEPTREEILRATADAATR